MIHQSFYSYIIVLLFIKHSSQYPIINTTNMTNMTNITNMTNNLFINNIITNNTQDILEPNSHNNLGLLIITTICVGFPLLCILVLLMKMIYNECIKPPFRKCINLLTSICIIKRNQSNQHNRTNSIFIDTDFNIYNEDYYQTPDNYNDTTILQKYIINDTNDNKDSNDLCSICIDNFSNNTIIKLKCNHKFHYDCFIPWIENKNNSCPLCRNIIV
jgi:hypothetical protein